MSSTVYIKLTSAANGSQWNPVFPTPGQNNSSKGFYTQWDAIDSAFQQTNTELSLLQSLQLAFTGDASGTSSQFGTAPSVGGIPTLTVPVNLSTTGVTAGSYNTTNGNLSLTIDASGRIHSASVTPKQIQNYTANTVLAPSGNIGAGTGTITFPTVAFDANGTLAVAGTSTMTYGLQNQTLSHNSLLFGGVNNLSSELTAPIDGADYLLSVHSGVVAWRTPTSVLPTSPSDGNTYTLQENNGVLSWNILSVPREIPTPPSDTTNKYELQVLNGTLLWGLVNTNTGTLTGVTAGAGITINNIDPHSPTLVSNFKANTTEVIPSSVGSTDVIGVQVPSGMQYMTVDNAKTLFTQVVRDTLPTLGGSLNTGIYNLYSDQASNGVYLTSAATNPASQIRVSQNSLTIQGSTTAPLSVNGVQWPSAAGSTGQYLSLSSNGSFVWTTLPSAPVFNQTINNTIFVGPNGNDNTGVGSLNNPYLSITKAISSLSSSSSAIQTIMLLGGTYTENITIQQLTNISIEGFFASTPSTIIGSLSLGFGITNFYMSNIKISLENQPATNTTPVFNVTTNIGQIQVKDCQLLRGGTDELSSLPVIYLNGSNTYDVTFTNTMIQGTIVNQMVSQSGSRVVINNAIIPSQGYVGLQTQTNTSTYLNGVPLVRGVRHDGGILNMTNVDSIRPLPYTVYVDQPNLPIWNTTDQKPLFLDINNVQVEANNPDNGRGTNGVLLQVNTGPDNLPQAVNLLDSSGNPVEDPAHLNTQPKTYLTTTYIQALTDPDPLPTTYNVGLYSDCDIAANGVGENSLTLTNVNFYYQGEFSPIYKSGNCSWTFTRVKRRADQDIVSGARIAYDVLPDEGQFLGRYVAQGNQLTYEFGIGTNVTSGSLVPGGYIDPARGNTFHITLKNTSTITLHTPVATSYSSEMYTELVVVLYQDIPSGGNWSGSFATDNNTNIIWLGGSNVNLNPGSYTFYTFRYLSTTRKWIGQKQDDGTTRQVNTVTASSDYTLRSSDVGAYVRRYGTSTNHVILPNSSSVNYALGTQIDVVQTGVGQTSILPASGVVINTPYGFALRAQFSRATMTKISDNIWDLSGDLDTTKTTATVVTVDSSLFSADSTRVTADGKIS